MEKIQTKQFKAGGDIPDAEDIRHKAITYSRHTISLWPPEDENARIAVRDIAGHLAKLVYFPESGHAPFTAAQYAIELAVCLRKAGPLVQLHGLLRNAHEAYLGQVPHQARLAEKAMSRPPLAFDRRDALEEAWRARIFQALGIPDFGERAQAFANDILYAKERLDDTLARDLGAHIPRAYPHKAEPMPRIVTPQPWHLALERHVRLYRDLTALCGLPAKD
jgi:hypothetical protein